MDKKSLYLQFSSRKSADSYKNIKTEAGVILLSHPPMPMYGNQSLLLYTRGKNRKVLYLMLPKRNLTKFIHIGYGINFGSIFKLRENYNVDSF